MNSVRTTLAKGDITRAVVARLTRWNALLSAWAVWTVVVAGLIAFTRGAPRDALDVLVLAVSASAGALLSVLVSTGFTVLRVRGALKVDDGLLGEHLYELKHDGLYEKTAVNETLAAWQAVKGVVQAGQFLFIEMRNGAFHIIPRRSFSSADHEKVFMSEARRRTAGDA